MSSVEDNRGYNQGYSLSWSVSIRTKRRSDYILGQMDLNKKNEILEIGCGLGDISHQIAQHPDNMVLGTDLCENFITRAREQYQMKNLQFSLLDFNHPAALMDKKFDYIIGNGILHHLYYNLDKALDNLKKLLNREGRIVFLEPNLLNPYCYLIFNTFPLFRRMAKLEPGEKAFTKRYIRNKLMNAGFCDIKIEYKDFLIPGTPSFLVNPVIFFGNVMERIPLLRNITQSIFISASYNE